MNRRGQMELIGIAFVVVVMVLGLMLYIGFVVLPNTGGSSPGAVQEASNYGSALHTAMLATTIPSCGYSFSTALERCATSSHLSCGSEPVCEATMNAWEDMLDATIGANNIRYTAKVTINDQLFNDDFEHNTEDCEGIQTRLAAPSQPISTSVGVIRSVIEFC